MTVYTSSTERRPLDLSPCRTPPKERTVLCAVCDAPFLTSASKARYCRPECRKLAYRALNREWYATHKPGCSMIAGGDRDRNETGLYKEPGSVLLSPHMTDEDAARVWLAVFAGRGIACQMTRAERWQARHGKQEEITAPPVQKKKMVCTCQTGRRTCAKCHRTYCSLCRTLVHPTCPAA